MSTASSSPATPPHSLGSGLANLRAKWGWIVALGVIYLIAGVLAFGSVFFATVVSVLFVGAMMIVAGVAEIINAFQFKTWGKFLLWMLLGVLYVAAGMIAIMNPLLAAAYLTLMLGFALVFGGVLRIFLAFQMKSAGGPWAWVALSGVITFALGCMIIVQWPASSLFVLGVFLGIDLIFIGAGWITMGLALKKRA